jgi:hypothetical protein
MPARQIGSGLPFMATRRSRVCFVPTTAHSASEKATSPANTLRFRAAVGCRRASRFDHLLVTGKPLDTDKLVCVMLCDDTRPLRASHPLEFRAPEPLQPAVSVLSYLSYRFAIVGVLRSGVGRSGADASDSAGRSLARSRPTSTAATTSSIAPRILRLALCRVASWAILCLVVSACILGFLRKQHCVGACPIKVFPQDYGRRQLWPWRVGAICLSGQGVERTRSSRRSFEAAYRLWTRTSPAAPAST